MSFYKAVQKYFNLFSKVLTAEKLSSKTFTCSEIFSCLPVNVCQFQLFTQKIRLIRYLEIAIILEKQTRRAIIVLNPLAGHKSPVRGPDCGQLDLVTHPCSKI